MSKPIVLWADLTHNGGTPELFAQFQEFCVLRKSSPNRETRTDKKKSAPDFGCLEYDYPDRRGLALLQRLKATHPSVPLIMITQTHSEALAVWAFRTGAWDYLTKPLSADELERVRIRMIAMMKARKNNAMRTSAVVESEMPPDARYIARGSQQCAVARAMSYMQTHFAEKITETKVADICGMSKFRFSRAFHQAYGATFRDSLLKIRLAEAGRLLENPKLTITQITFMAGFNDTSHFGKMFRRYYDQTASEYRVHLAEGETAMRRDTNAFACGSPPELANSDGSRESSPWLHAPPPCPR